MIELLQRRLPLDELKIFAVMLRVTRAAFLASTSLFHDGGVVSVTRANAGCDFGVAIQALEGGFTDTEFVTRCAVTSSGKRGVRAGQWSRRDLCERESGRTEKDYQRAPRHTTKSAFPHFSPRRQIDQPPNEVS